jgi:hypothetical protein
MAGRRPARAYEGASMIHYTCQYEMLPVVEGALAAHGYTVDAPLSRHAENASLKILTRGDGGVLLAYNTASSLAEIEIWGAAQSAASMLLESLPLRLDKCSLAAT